MKGVDVGLGPAPVVVSEAGPQMVRHHQVAHLVDVQRWRLRDRSEAQHAGDCDESRAQGAAGGAPIESPHFQAVASTSTFLRYLIRSRRAALSSKRMASAAARISACM